MQVGFARFNDDDFISITDIAKFINPDAPADVIKNWMRSKNTIELLGLWERLHNPDFKLVEFDQFRNEVLMQLKRLIKLNQIAIGQMKILLQENETLKKLRGK